MKNHLLCAELCKQFAEKDNQIAELKEELESKSSIIADLDESEGNLVHSLGEAKDIIKELLTIHDNTLWQTKLKDWKSEIIKNAENFLKGE